MHRIAVGLGPPCPSCWEGEGRPPSCEDLLGAKETPQDDGSALGPVAAELKARV